MEVLTILGIAFLAIAILFALWFMNSRGMFRRFKKKRAVSAGMHKVDLTASDLVNEMPHMPRYAANTGGDAAQGGANVILGAVDLPMDAVEYGAKEPAVILGQVGAPEPLREPTVILGQAVEDFNDEIPPGKPTVFLGGV